MTALRVRPPAVAGMFYPAQAAELDRQLTDMLGDAAAPRPGEAPKALIAPHAGYRYSGPVAASAYAQLVGRVDCISTVVLLGPAHRVAVRGCAVPSVDAFRTPLGDVPIAHSLRDRLDGRDGIIANDEAHADEHSVEVHLPFLQEVLGDFELLPVVVGRASAAEVADLLELVWGGPETLVVVSTDLSHFHDQATAGALDRVTAEAIVDLRHADVSPDRACGAHPLAGLLEVAARRSMQIVELDRRTSADTAGSPERVVGYGAFALHESGPPRLGPSAAERLLTLAVAAARAEVAGVADAELTEVEPELSAWRPAFVTLHHAGRLRGCVGDLRASEPLAAAVVRAARRACHDPRLPAIQASEIDELDLSVSVVGPLERVVADSRDELLGTLRPGLDGVVLDDGRQRATFLPTVWASVDDATAFVDRLVAKGGWPADIDIATLTVHRYVTQHLGVS